MKGNKKQSFQKANPSDIIKTNENQTIINDKQGQNEGFFQKIQFSNTQQNKNIKSQCYCETETEQTVTSFYDIRKVYKFEPEIIGLGRYGIVHKARLFNNVQKVFAVKTISKEKNAKTLHLLKREVQIMKQLDHPNIIKLHETYQDDKYLHMVFDYCGGGDLQERVMNKQALDERETIIVLRQICYAVKYLHQQEICHRDLKLQNFLFTNDLNDLKANQQNSLELKLIDFGLSKERMRYQSQQNLSNDQGPNQKQTYNFNNQHVNLHTVAGTAVFVAPEVHSGFYGLECDMWSIGIMAYIMLSGSLPFPGESDSQIIALSKKGDFSFYHPVWQTISQQAKDFISSLLQLDISKRLTSFHVLEHDFLSGKTINFFKMKQIQINNIAERLLQYDTIDNKLKIESLKVLLFLIKDESWFSFIQYLFTHYDRDFIGSLRVNQYTDVQSKHNYNIQSSSSQVQHNDDTNKFNYCNFKLAMINDVEHLDDVSIEKVFNYFDISNNNYISQIDITEILARRGRGLSEAQVSSMMAQFLQDGNLKQYEMINYDQERIDLQCFKFIIQKGAVDKEHLIDFQFDADFVDVEEEIINYSLNYDENENETKKIEHRQWQLEYLLQK